MDSKIRELERLAAQGDVEANRLLQRHLQRMGSIIDFDHVIASNRGLQVVSFDTETLLLSENSLAPRIMCLTLATLETSPQGDQHISSAIYTNGDPEFRDVLRWIVEDEKIYRVGLNLAYDLSCICTTDPSLYPAVFRLLEAGKATDCKLREQLMNLSTSGRMDQLEIVDAQGRTFTKRLSYSMLSLAKKYLGLDMTEAKEDENAWRLRYSELDGLRRDQYPKEALQYALEDAINTLRIYLEQEKVLQNPNLHPRPVVNTQEFQTLADFSLYQVSQRGFKVDKNRRARLEQEVAEALSPANMMPLYEAGILRPGSPAMPYANGARNPDGTPKMKAAVKDSVNTKALKALVEEVCRKNNIKVKTTPTGGISTDAEVLADISHLDPVLTVYEKRQGWLKIVSTELPRMQADYIFTNYRSLVETGRTSSWGSSKEKGAPVASMNSQNVDPRARTCYVARDGFVMVSSDYKALELVSLAQQMHRLYQSGAITLPSRLKLQLDAGDDPHSHVASQLAKKFSPEFSKLCEQAGAFTNDEVYALFYALKKYPEGSEEAKFFKHWRKFAKPVSLGFPGGLAARTFVGFAKATYEVIVSEQQAEQMKEVWYQTYPEMRAFFAYVNNRLGKGDEYSYTSPMGMVRRGASYCAAANGFALQTPSAECAKWAVFQVVRACYDPTAMSVLDPSKPSYLRGSYVLAFVHDELILEIPIGPHTHEACMELKKIMENALIAGMPDMAKAVQANPAVMFRWNKDAEPVYDDKKRLVPWDLKNEWGADGLARWLKVTAA
jgi:DNA polymerase I-like protein with 3'-5' exonuclease and polymerase domains